MLQWSRFTLPIIGLLVACVCAQTQSSLAQTTDYNFAALNPKAKLTEADQQKKLAREKELRDLTRDISISEARREKIKRSIRNLDRDRETLNGELIRTGERIKQLENQLKATEARLLRHRENEDIVRASLNERRHILAEVLGALQRIGHRPPPAMAVRPKDALTAVRSAILLNAVMPEVRIEAEALASDLTEMTRLREKVEEEQKRFKASSLQLEEEQHRVELLLQEKKKQRTENEQELAEERRRAKELADKATSLKELLANLEREVGSSKRAALEARKAEQEQASRRARLDPFADPGRLRPQIAFRDAKGLLPMPVSGTILQDYGVADGFGNKTNGQSIITRANAQITSPTDGWVVYAGEFRSYGQLIIINAGNGYNVVLAGMDYISVELGQFVLAGEPVAKMGETRLASANTLNFSADQPVLYIEFRKGGTPINPKPWWSRAENEKVSG